MANEITYSTRDLQRIIAEKQRRLDDLAHPGIWERYTRHMEGGEYRKFKQSCIDDEIIISVLQKEINRISGSATVSEADQMTDREKLIELLKTPIHPRVGADPAEVVADYLLDSGVSFVNNWVSVEDRLPECNQDVLMYFDAGNMACGFWYDGDEDVTFWRAYTDDGWYTDCDCEPLYWMLPPEPPKEEL